MATISAPISQQISSHSRLGFFDDDNNWSDDRVGIVENEGIVTSSMAINPRVERVSPLVRAIFDRPQNHIRDGKQGASSKNQAGAELAASLRNEESEKHCTVEVGYEEMLGKKVRALEEEMENFKKENRRLKKLAKETEERSERLAHEKAEWEQQKMKQLHLFKVQQEEQIDRLKKERVMLEVRSQAMLVPPAVQRKEVEELRSSLRRQQDEQHVKERRWLSTVSRLRLMNDNLTRQVLELQEEIKQYESCVLASHCGGNSVNKGVRPMSINSASVDPNRTISDLRKEEIGEISSGQLNMENREVMTTIDTFNEEMDDVSSKSKHGLLIKQAKLLSQLYRHPWKGRDSTNMLWLGNKNLPQGKYTNLQYHGQKCYHYGG